MLPYRFRIANVNVWNATGVALTQDLEVEGGVITKLGPTGSLGFTKNTDDVFDGLGRALLPAGIDLQVHLRVPGQAHKETAETGLKAALRGGIVAVLSMPNTNPVIDSPEVCELTRKLVAPAEQSTGVKVLLSAAMTQGQLGSHTVDAKKLAACGVTALTDDGRGVASEDIMREVFRASAQSGLPVLQHAEVPGHGAALAAGPTQQKLGLKAYPPEAEWKMVERDLRLLEDVCKEFPQSKPRYHVLHISSAKTLELVVDAKKRGLPATCEVCPHHLFFTSGDVPVDNSDFKMNPPLRGADDRRALQKGLQDGGIDFVSTDHAPHEKSLKSPDFQASAFGTTGLETSLRTLWALVGQGALTRERLVETFSTAPARFLGWESGYGTLAQGRPFRAVWFDDQAQPAPIRLDELESLSKNNCFLGHPLPGRVCGVWNDAGFFRF